MNIDKILLPPSLIAGLYPDSLIDPGKNEHINRVESTLPVSPSNANKDSGTTFKSLGNNKKNILVLVKNAETVFLPDNELTFLTGILNACKLTLDDVAILNIHHYPGVPDLALSNFFKSKIVLLFSVEPLSLGLPLDFPQFQIQPFSNKTFLFSPSLKELEDDKILKSKLWVCLKRIFNL